MSTDTAHQDDTPAGLAAIAAGFVAARRQGSALDAFPGDIPGDLVTAYQVQDLAIANWPDTVVGWKVGYIAAERRDGSGDERLLGPIFSRQLWNATGGSMPIPVFVASAADSAEYKASGAVVIAKAAYAYDRGITGKGVMIAVLDTGGRIGETWDCVRTVIPDPGSLFRDGFEAGDTSAWSFTAP